MAEKTKKPIKLRKRAPEIVRQDRQARGKQRNQRNRAATEYLHTMHGSLPPDEDLIPEHDPSTKPRPEQVVEHGMPRLYLAGLSRVHFAIRGQSGRDDRVQSRWTIHALHSGELFGVPPTGREVTFSGVHLCVTDAEEVKVKTPWVNRMNRLVESIWIAWVLEDWTYWDLPSLVAQLRGEGGSS